MQLWPRQPGLSQGKHVQVRGDNIAVIRWLEGRWVPRDLVILAALSRARAAIYCLLRRRWRAPPVEDGTFRHIFREHNDEADHFSKYPKERVRTHISGSADRWVDIVCTFDGAHTATHGGVAWILWGRPRSYTSRVRPGRQPLLRYSDLRTVDWHWPRTTCFEWEVVADGSWTVPAGQSSTEVELVAAVSLMKYLQSVCIKDMVTVQLGEMATPTSLRRHPRDTFSRQVLDALVLRHGYDP